MTTTIRMTSTMRTVLLGLGIGAALGVFAQATIGVAHADPAPVAPPHDDRPGPPPGGHHGPPPEAIAACNGKAVDAVCSVTFGGRDHAGTCQNGPDGKGELACAPAGPPPAPPQK